MWKWMCTPSPWIYFYLSWNLQAFIQPDASHNLQLQSHQYLADLLGLYCLKPIWWYMGDRVSSTEKYSLGSNMLFIQSLNMLVSARTATNRFVLQSWRLFSGSSKDITEQRNKNLCFNIVTLKTGCPAGFEKAFCRYSTEYMLFLTVQESCGRRGEQWMHGTRVNQEGK